MQLSLCRWWYIVTGYIRVARIHRIHCTSLTVKEVLFFLLSLGTYSISDWGQLRRRCNNLPIRVVLNLAYMMCCPVRRLWRAILIMLFLHLYIFFLDWHLTFFDNSKMSLLVYQLNFPFKTLPKRFTLRLFLTFWCASLLHGLFIRFNRFSIIHHLYERWWVGSSIVLNQIVLAQTCVMLRRRFLSFLWWLIINGGLLGYSLCLGPYWSHKSNTIIRECRGLIVDWVLSSEHLLILIIAKYNILRNSYYST